MMGYKARRVPHMDNLCIPGGYFWGRTSENSVKAKFAEFYFLKVRRTRKKSQDLKPRLFHGCSLDWPGLSRKKYRTPQEETPDSPGRNTGLSRKYVLQFSCKPQDFANDVRAPLFVYCYIVVY